MSLRKIVSVFLALASISAAKFDHTYRGIASEGVQTCIANSNFTPTNITSKSNCRVAFECVMQNIPNQSQSILSSGSAILGFIPTVLLLLGNNNEDIIRISTQFPLLALFLSVTNVNQTSARATRVPADRDGSCSLGPYGHVSDTISTPTFTWAGYITVVIIHVLAAAGAAIVVWQSVDLGRKAVVTWACWTDFYPLIWVSLAVVHHLKAVVFLRLSLRISLIKYGKSSRRIYLIFTSGLLVWKLVQENQRIELAHKKFLRWSKASADFLNHLNFLYGTAIFSSLTLVSGRNAILVLAIYGMVAVFSRVMAVWVLETLIASNQTITEPTVASIV